MERPDHLPDFSDPPLDEVVLGLQFAPVPAYNPVHSLGIWELFKNDFPQILEKPLLEPTFETFGGPNPQPGLQFQVGAPPVGSRLWFLSEDENHLLQFQRDRFLMNWRRRFDSQVYPHFESLLEGFKAHFQVLSQHFATDFDYTLEINQMEVTYINIIPVDDFRQIGQWFRIWNSEAFDIEALGASFSEVTKNEDSQPFARLTHQIQSAVLADGKKKAFRFSLTFRGKLPGNDAKSAMRFLEIGREKIVLRFDEMTTADAHKCWGKLV